MMRPYYTALELVFTHLRAGAENFAVDAPVSRRYSPGP